MKNKLTIAAITTVFILSSFPVVLLSAKAGKDERMNTVVIAAMVSLFFINYPLFDF